MARTGKIARLPSAIREQVNQRILEGQSGDIILRWLNSLPEVKSLLAAEFDSHPLTPNNLSEWRRGGFRDWLVRRETLNLFHSLDDKESLGEESLTAPLADKLAHWLTLQYAAEAARHLASEDLQPEARWTRLRQLCVDVARLQREEHRTRQLDLQKERLELDAVNTEWQFKKDQHKVNSQTLTHKAFNDAREKVAQANPALAAALGLAFAQPQPSTQKPNRPV